MPLGEGRDDEPAFLCRPGVRSKTPAGHGRPQTVRASIVERGFFQRGGGWVLGQSVLMGLVLAGAPLTRDAWDSNLGRWPGWLLVGAGAWLGIGGAVVLGRSRTIFPAPREDAALVTRGIYRRVRHPLYGSLMCLSAGWSLLWASGVGLALGAVLSVFLRFKAGREEQWLRERFPGYEAYAATVRRFLPWIW